MVSRQEPFWWGLVTELGRWWKELSFLIIRNQRTSSWLPLTSCTYSASWFISSLPVMLFSHCSGPCNATSTQTYFQLEYSFAAASVCLEWTYCSISILSLPSTSEESECVYTDEKCFRSLLLLFNFFYRTDLFASFTLIYYSCLSSTCASPFLPFIFSSCPNPPLLPLP